MTKQRRLFVALQFGIVLLIGIGIIVWAGSKDPIVIHKIIMVVDPNYVQPPCEAQRRLKEQGLYHGKIDNIWGPESDKAYCDYMAIEAIEGR